MKSRFPAGWIGAALLVLGGPASAAVVVETLPYQGTPDWVDIVFAGTSMTTDGTTSTLTTAHNRGVWFGWGNGYSNAAQGWAPGTNAQGNHLSLSAAFSAGATDWSAYFYDGVGYAGMLFNSVFTHHECNGNNNSCYAIELARPEQGVTVYHAEIEGRTFTFKPLDMSQQHTYEFLLKGTQVAYRVDGELIYAGPALLNAAGTRLLVIGDGSGSTLTGEGSMTVYGVSLDNAPVAHTLISTVPEPGGALMLLAGLGLIGLSVHRGLTA